MVSKQELLKRYIPPRTLRSSSITLLYFRAFSSNAPVLWNSLPEDIRRCKSLTTFKSKRIYDISYSFNNVA